MTDQPVTNATMKSRFIIVFSILVLWAHAAIGQVSRIGEHDPVSGWSVASASVATQTETKKLIQQILDAAGLKANFQVQPANIPNAAAVTYRGSRYILYNPKFLEQLNQRSGTKWAAVSVLAHEAGHHLKTGNRAAAFTQQQLELDADEFSGYVLKRMGASLEEAQVAMRVGTTERGSRTHPGQMDRLVAIEKGWNNSYDPAYAVKTGAGEGRGTATSSDDRAAASATISREAVLGEVKFNAAPASKFFITSDFNLVELKNSSLSVIGKLTSLASREYPYLIYDQANTQLLVDRQGNILTKSGKQIGTLKSYR
jgi:hypothetical protein